jgi:AmmeMemoRadiSam system protein B
LDEEETKPRIRPVEAIPLEAEGRKMIVLRDGSGISDAQLVVSPTAFFVVTLFDGTNTVRDMQAAFMRKVGELLPSEKIQEIVERLDDAMLLEGPRFDSHLEGLIAEFRDSPVRAPTLAGQAYEEEPDKLAEQIESYYGPPEGPGRPVPGKREAPLPALIAPHIDLERGGTSYAAAWAVAAEGPPPDSVVVLGTAHQGASPGLFIGAKKAFRTPMGESPLDEEIMGGLASRLGENFFADEFVHAREHSVEFQVLFAQHTFGHEIPVVPVLACSFHEFVLADKDPFADDRVHGFVTALQESVRDSGKKVLVVASADLAHVGPKFGDSTVANDMLLDAVRRSDMELLKDAGQIDAENFFRKIAKQGDRTRVCGFPSIYTLLRYLEGSEVRGMLRKYGSTVDPQGSAVTFAGMTFE